MMKKLSKIFLLIALAAALAGCGRPNRGGNTAVEGKDTVKTEQIKPLINVYIENSGSMDGYVKGNTEFKGAIRDLLVMLKYHYDESNIKIFFINSDVHPTATDIDLTTFAQVINVHWRTGNRSNTNLNHIFKMILDKTDKRTVSLLFSDCIYSIKGTDTDGLLSSEKSLTKDAFQSKWKTDSIPLATIIMKMKSKFDGTYYPYTGSGTSFSVKKELPYYICIVGNNNIMHDFNKTMELKKGKIEGFENKYILSPSKSTDIYWSVLQTSFNQGRFKPDRTKSGADYIHGIEDVNLTRGVNQLSFAIAVDFSEIQEENDYIVNPANYAVTTDNFTVTEIAPIDKSKIKPNDWNRIGKNNPTHVIILEAKSKAASSLSLALQKQTPQWVMESNTEDDTSPEKLGSKTFGLKYWVGGITEAFQKIYPHDKNHFECSISIK
ncbi:MAG: hypothetical protein LBD59_09480 [Prevotellaceae bacterium]|jgi:hypothetical protein|nr:hypothetical protein [Prevotellaceae bacterium]